MLVGGYFEIPGANRNLTNTMSTLPGNTASW